MAQVTDDNGKLLEGYLYWPDGRRLQKFGATTSPLLPAPTTRFFWDGGKVISEYILPNTIGSQWTWSKEHVYLGDRSLATFVGPNSDGLAEGVYYQHPDLRGVRYITNGVDQPSFEQVALPFGTLIPGIDPINPIFTSYDRSSLTGLDYAVNRFYNSSTRFLQPDPAEMAAADLTKPQSLNEYAYVANEPIMHVDPLGLDACFDNDDGGKTSTCVPEGGSNMYIIDNASGKVIYTYTSPYETVVTGSSDAGIPTWSSPTSPCCSATAVSPPPPGKSKCYSLSVSISGTAGASPGAWPGIFGGGGASVGVTSNGQLFAQAQAAGMTGVGLYAGVGFNLNIGISDQPPPNGLSTSPSWHSELNGGWGTSLGASLDVGQGSGSVGFSPLPKVGGGWGLMAGTGAATSTTYAVQILNRAQADAGQADAGQSSACPNSP